MTIPKIKTEMMRTVTAMDDALRQYTTLSAEFSNLVMEMFALGGNPWNLQETSKETLKICNISMLQIKIAELRYRVGLVNGEKPSKDETPDQAPAAPMQPLMLEVRVISDRQVLVRTTSEVETTKVEGGNP